jgi:NitT/TauT family transport system ATP-binding protein
LVLQRELLDLWEQNRTTVVFITHDIDEAILLSDRILLMSSQPGRIIREFPVRLPRPRTTRVCLTGEYQELKQAILDGLGLR